MGFSQTYQQAVMQSEKVPVAKGIDVPIWGKLRT